MRNSDYQISFERLQEGDEHELELFFNSFYGLFVSFARNFLSDEDACEDIVQEAILSFWEKRETFENIHYARAFLYKGIRNKCLNHIRHQQVRLRHAEYETLEKTELESSTYFLDTIIKEESARIIYRAIEHLSPVGRKVMLLSIEGSSNEEIALKLGVSINTIRTHKARNYQYLREKLAELHLLLPLLIS